MLTLSKHFIWKYFNPILLFLNTSLFLFFSFKLIHLEQYRFTANLSGKCREFPMPCPHTCSTAPTMDVLHCRGTVEPELTYRYHTIPSFTSGFIFYRFGHMCNDMYLSHYDITENSYIALKILCALFTPPAPWVTFHRTETDEQRLVEMHLPVPLP